MALNIIKPRGAPSHKKYTQSDLDAMEQEDWLVEKTGTEIVAFAPQPGAPPVKA